MGLAKKSGTMLIGVEEKTVFHIYEMTWSMLENEMRIGALVSNKELGRGIVLENEGSGWLVNWYEHGEGNKLMKTVIYKTSTYPIHWSCGGGFGPIQILSLGGQKSCWQDIFVLVLYQYELRNDAEGILQLPSPRSWG